MDSLTQFTLGAAVGEAVLGKRLGRKAALWGGVLGTLPDMDILIPMGNAVADFTYHRSFSHSLFVLAVLTPLIAWLAMRVHKHREISRIRWWSAIYAIFATHVLLDSFTAYGTQIFWPFITTPMTWSTLFIIDPLYTVPLLLGLLCVQITRREGRLGHVANRIGLVVSTLYLAFSVAAKAHVEHRIAKEVAAQGIDSTSWFSTPAPFNTILWRVVVMVENGYYEVFYSLLDGDVPMQFAFYPSQNDLLEPIGDSWPVTRLQWFSKGFYSVRNENGAVIISDLRMGVEPRYVFRFKVAKITNPHTVEVEPELLPPDRSLDGLRLVWDRIWQPQVPMAF